MSLLTIKRTSAWRFDTSATGGLGVGFVVASGGRIALLPPGHTDTDHPSWLNFGGAGVGVGLSAGVRKIPKVGRLVDSRGLSERGGANAAPANFWKNGVLYVMNGCRTDELTLDDFKGTCCFIDIGFGLILGYAGFGLLLNVNPRVLATLTQPVIGPLMFETMANPHALLLSRGWNVGPQASAGISFSEGWVW